MILGAGASVQFSLPIGGSLLDEIRRKVSSELKLCTSFLHNYNYDRIISEFYGAQGYGVSPKGLDDKVYRRSPIFATYLYSIIGTTRATDANFRALIAESKRAVKALHNQTADTIDALIAQNPSVSKILKIAVANIFFETLYDGEDSHMSGWTLHTLADRVLKDERNWVHLLINLVRHAHSEKWVSQSNKVKIITFNYDTILEKILDDAFSNTEEKIPQWRELIEVVHMHGCMPYLKNEVMNALECTASMADAIEVATELQPRQEVRDDRKQAAQWIKNAQQIYACGFAFAGPNCRLLGLDENRARKHIRFCNFDGAPGITNSASRYGIYEVKAQNLQLPHRPLLIEDGPRPTKDETLSITNWFYRGAPGELPA